MPAAVGFAAPLPVLPDPLALPIPANDTPDSRGRESIAHNPVRQPDPTDRRLGRTGRVKAFLRPRGKPADPGARRTDGDGSPQDQRSGRVQLDFGAHSSRFLAQLVAQREPGGQARDSVQAAAAATGAYQTVLQRSEAFLGPLIPTEIRV